MEKSRYEWEPPRVAGETTGGPRESRPAGAGSVRMGFIGLGTMGGMNLERFAARPDVRVTALCDVDRTHLAEAAATARTAGGRDDFGMYRDFRELNRAADVDAVVISTPDHWHAIQSIDAMHNGKDVYVEKPLSLTVADGRAIVDATARTALICQVGTQQRSSREFRRACELVRNGRLGQLTAVNVELPANNRPNPVDWQPMPVPDGFDYDLWLGPAPAAPYHEQRCHYSFRFIRDYSGGQMTNWGAHHLDIVQWALDMDDSGPIAVRGRGDFPETGLFNTAISVEIEYTYPNGVRVTCRTGDPHVEFVGTMGRLWVARGRIETEPARLLHEEMTASDQRLYVSDDHRGNFLDCVRSRRQPVSPAAVGHRSATVCHIGNIAMLIGRPLAWNPETERFADDEANRLLSRPGRAPWVLPRK